jgi:hypothetical protein
MHIVPIHDDHLGGSSVIAGAGANVAQVLEYYPFGLWRNRPVMAALHCGGVSGW